jgi:hypothetical protein
MTASSIVHHADEDLTSSSMMAWRVHEFGPPSVMKFERVLRPNAGLRNSAIAWIALPACNVNSMSAWEEMMVARPSRKTGSCSTLQYANSPRFSHASKP